MPPSSSPTAIREFARLNISANISGGSMETILLQLAVQKGMVGSDCAATFMQA